MIFCGSARLLSGWDCSARWRSRELLNRCTRLTPVSLEANPDMTRTQARMRTRARVYLPEDRMSDKVQDSRQSCSVRRFEAVEA